MSATDKKITLAEAISWTSAWRSAPSTSARAFLIPIQDLQGVLNEISGQGGNPCARAYLAIDGGVEKLIFVGTSQETQPDKSVIYRDLLPAAGEEATSSNSIYDFTNPCPPDCDPSSPLN
ncbi:hypothetical protein POV27_11895 [Aureisphaera galaxeae]|uniref:hypothetical protein n=1 Tax=Aureisphaera galaxeae TaxID=1538023 RepID=UPI00234FD517|nr:hypothetical protein [Aureisphaera galaxeae]MDC8004756.1 hypothetical protein [Aureisphaera galaxeae]